MKPILMGVAVVIVVGWLFVWIGAYALRRSFTVGHYSYVLPATEMSEVPDALILDGLRLALQRFGLEPRAWVVSADSRWQPTNSAGISVASLSLTNVVIVMSNQIDGMKLFVRLQPSSRTNTVEYSISRGK